MESDGRFRQSREDDAALLSKSRRQQDAVARMMQRTLEEDPTGRRTLRAEYGLQPPSASSGDGGASSSGYGTMRRGDEDEASAVTPLSGDLRFERDEDVGKGVVAAGESPTLRAPPGYLSKALEQQGGAPRPAKRRNGAFVCRVMAFVNGVERDIELELRANATASELAARVLERSGVRELQGPCALYLADDDGGLDSMFPPLEPNAIVSKTGVKRFCLVQRAEPLAPAQDQEDASGNPSAEKNGGGCCSCLFGSKSGAAQRGIEDDESSPSSSSYHPL